LSGFLTSGRHISAQISVGPICRIILNTYTRQHCDVSRVSPIVYYLFCNKRLLVQQ